MLGLIFAMLVATGLGVAVVAVVALPARRDGRWLLTARGARVLRAARTTASRGAGVVNHRTADTH